METNIIGSIKHSDKVVFMRQEIEMYYIINGDKPWILCTWEADTPNTNLHCIIQHTELQTQPDLVAELPTVLHNPKAALVALINSLGAGTRAAVIALIKSLVASSRAAAATAIIKTLAPVAM
jgi:hypothetical protein